MNAYFTTSFTQMKISFYFKKCQTLELQKQGLGIIYYYVIIDNRKSVEKSTKIRCYRTEWDEKAMKFQGHDADNRNKKIRYIYDLLERNKNVKEMMGEEISTETIEMKFHDNRFRRTFNSVLEEYMNEQFQKIRKPTELKHKGNIEASTYKSYEKRKKNIDLFLEEIERPNLLISEFNARMCERFDTYLTASRKTGQDYATKHIKLVRTVLLFAKRSNIVKIDFTEAYKLKHEAKKKVKTINVKDYEVLEAKRDMVRECDQKYIDLLLLMRETFLNISDLMELNEKLHFKKDETGRSWIIKPRKKRIEENKQIQMIPLSKKALDIIKKYDGIDNLPRRCPLHINRRLKVIFAIVGIDKNISTKMGRSSGISIKFNRDKLRTEIIQVVAGWTSTREIDNYLVHDMDELSNDFLGDE